MPIVQISQIHCRMGLKLDLPDLEPGEFGFTRDTGELFIGTDPLNNRTRNRNYPPYKNIKVLTEFDAVHHLSGEVYYHGPLHKVTLVSNGVEVQILDFDTINTSKIVLDFDYEDNVNKECNQLGTIVIMYNSIGIRSKIDRMYMVEPPTPSPPVIPTGSISIDNHYNSRLSFRVDSISNKLILLATLINTGLDGSVGGDGVITVHAKCWR